MNAADHTRASRPVPRVFIVDDDVSVRESLALLVSTAGWQPETFSCVRDFLLRAPTPAPNCLLLDFVLPDQHGLDLQRRMLTDQVDIPIIFVTAYGDVETTVQAMKAGALELLTKPLNEAVLLTAIGGAIERSHELLDEEQKNAELRDRYASLSNREREVMALVVCGLLNKQIASKLGISEITVKAHRGTAMRKMKASSLAGLVKMAARLVEPRGG